jgi:hypothetical protein
MMAMRLVLYQSCIVTRDFLKKNLPTSTRSTNDAEIVTRLGRIFRVDAVHYFLEDVQRRKTPDAAVIKAEKFELSLIHFSLVQRLVQMLLEYRCEILGEVWLFINVREVDIRPCKRVLGHSRS